MRSMKFYNTLQLKILSGYILLSVLILGIVIAVWYEKQVFKHVEMEERTMLTQRKLSNSTFKSLLSLFLDSEHVIPWDEKDLQTYRNKEKQVFQSLDKLRNSYPDTVQQARIDTVKSLLYEKKRQISLLIKTPSTVSRIDDLLFEKLPSLMASTSALEMQEKKEPVKKKKKGLFSWLKRKEKQEIPSQTEETKQGSSQIYRMQQFQRDMSAVLHGQETYIMGLADTLELRNKELNRNINRLVDEFEQDAMMRMIQRQEDMSRLRDHAFGMICIISSICLLCVILLYILSIRIYGRSIITKTVWKRQTNASVNCWNSARKSCSLWHMTYAVRSIPSTEVPNLP